MKALKAVLAAILLLLVAAAIYLALPAYRARHLLAQVATLEVGKSTFADAQQIAAHASLASSNPCTADACAWYRRINNLALPQRWIGQGATFSAGFRVQHGIVTERGFAYQLGTGGLQSPFADVEERAHWSGIPPDPVSIQTQWTAHVPRYSVFVFMVPDVPAATRSQYLSFNLGCLWHYGGCTDAQQLLPTVDWK